LGSKKPRPYAEFDANASGPPVAACGIDGVAVGDGGGTTLLRLNRYILKKKKTIVCFTRKIVCYYIYFDLVGMHES